jgi:hypothetical protein
MTFGASESREARHTRACSRDVLMDTIPRSPAKIRRPPLSRSQRRFGPGRGTFMGTEPRGAWRLQDGRVDTAQGWIAGEPCDARSVTVRFGFARNSRWSFRTWRVLVRRGWLLSTTWCARSAIALRLTRRRRADALFVSRGHPDPRQPEGVALVVAVPVPTVPRTARYRRVRPGDERTECVERGCGRRHLSLAWQIPPPASADPYRGAVPRGR